MSPRIPKFFALALFAAAASASVSSAESPPNIVYIISDDQSWTDYGFMGHPVIETPHLDALSSRSATFTRGYVPTALCRPSLMTFATGLYAHQHLTTGNDPAPSPETGNKKQGPRYQQLRADLIAHIDQQPTLPKLLADRGYLSHQSGKWWEGNYTRGGFTHGMTRGFPQPRGRHGDDGLDIGRQGLAPVTDFIDHAVAEKKPFFLWYAPFMPHTPHTPPKRLLDKYVPLTDSLTVAKYYAMCEWFDETCGELLGYLDKKGLTENTLVVYICDNGWTQDPDGPHDLPRSKRSPYDAGTRQPILLSWPGRIAPGTRADLVSSIDLAPTALAAAGVDAPAGLPGLDLLPLVGDGKPLGRDTIFGESFAHDIADISDPSASLLHRWTIHGDYKLLVDYPGKADTSTMKSDPLHGSGPRLYNLTADPHETKNLAGDPGHARVLAELQSRLDAWVAPQE